MTDIRELAEIVDDLAAEVEIVSRLVGGILFMTEMRPNQFPLADVTERIVQIRERLRDLDKPNPRRFVT